MTTACAPSIDAGLGRPSEELIRDAVSVDRGDVEEDPNNALGLAGLVGVVTEGDRGLEERLAVIVGRPSLDPSKMDTSAVIDFFPGMPASLDCLYAASRSCWLMDLARCISLLTGGGSSGSAQHDDIEVSISHSDDWGLVSRPTDGSGGAPKVTVLCTLAMPGAADDRRCCGSAECRDWEAAALSAGDSGSPSSGIK